MAKTKAVFECESCGYQCGKWLGKCPNCGAFESIVELSAAQIKSLEEIAKFNKSASPSAKATPITEVEITELARTSTGDSELDLVLGGGLVEGSLVLIGGSPGIGKSTLLLKVASNLAKNAPTLYVSGEESASQIKLRADRLGANERELFLLTEINLGAILTSLGEREYKFLVIDSIQTLYSDKITAAPGSISQVREITFELMRLAKEKNISIFIIGHITKEGSIAGPRILEHMVDVVLYFEGDSSKQLRILRGFKNRFGNTSEVGIFEMSEQGLKSAKDASSKFFTRGAAVAGSAITATMQGSRALIVEIQALVCESAYPKRSTTGFDKSRLDMILALLERKLELPLGHYDVFINVTGGVKITESACDLAVVAAIISSFRNRPLSRESIFIGELSLNGEIRDIFNLDERLKEAATQNFKNAICPKKPSTKPALKVFEAGQISQVLEWM